MRGEFAFLKEPLASDAASYSYGDAHPIQSGAYPDAVPSTTRVQVHGRAVFAERFDWVGVASGRERLVEVLDANLATQPQAEDRADAVLRQAAVAAAAGEITVPVNCGQELYDVIEVTDAGAGLSAAKRRVIGLELRYSSGKRPRYEQRITLGGV